MTSSRTSQDTLDDAVRACDIPAGARLLVAVSGGPDSVVLLDTLHRLAPEQGWTLRIGHVNHGLRGPEADADERFVRRLAETYQLQIDIQRVDVSELARRTRQSLEAAARHARYACLEQWLHRWPGDAIVTGHTLDDQAETVLLQLIRGAGIAGLGGMGPREGILRPLLGVQRATVKRVLAERQLAFRDDSSNRDRHFRRNALRLDVMPAILALDPAAPRSIARAGGYLQPDAGYLTAEARRALLSMALRRETAGVSASRFVWCALHQALRRHTLRGMVEQILGTLRDVDGQHIDVIEDAVMRGVAVEDRLPHNLRIVPRGPRFVIETGENGRPEHLSAVTLPVPENVSFGPWSLIASRTKMDRPLIEHWLAVCGPYHALLDAAAVGGPLEVRARQPGDRVQPLGMRGSRKLQDILVDRKIPASERDVIPLLASDDHVIWVPGIATDRRYVATPETVDLLHVSVKPREE